MLQWDSCCDWYVYRVHILSKNAHMAKSVRGLTFIWWVRQWEVAQQYLSAKIMPLGNWFYVLYVFQDGTAELIFYDRPDSDGPKICKYEKCTLPDGSQIASVLSHALGVKGCVKKKRQLFMVGQTRVHIDHVEDLGNFMELEVSTCFKCRLWLPVV